VSTSNPTETRHYVTTVIVEEIVTETMPALNDARTGRPVGPPSKVERSKRDVIRVVAQRDSKLAAASLAIRLLRAELDESVQVNGQ
jgi:hypothetical protein